MVEIIPHFCLSARVWFGRCQWPQSRTRDAFVSDMSSCIGVVDNLLSMFLILFKRIGLSGGRGVVTTDV